MLHELIYFLYSIKSLTLLSDFVKYILVIKELGKMEGKKKQTNKIGVGAEGITCPSASLTLLYFCIA